MEIKRGGIRYTWTNKQSCPVMVNLDRVLVTTDWEAVFPCCNVQSLARVGSYHNPILLDSGEGKSVKKRSFFFEQKWMCQENFKSLVQDKWIGIESKTSDDFYSVDKWNGCLASLRSFS